MSGAHLSAPLYAICGVCFSVLAGKVTMVRDKRFYPKRTWVLMVAVSAAFGGLAVRAAHIQWWARPYYLRIAAVEPGRHKLLRGPRGRLLDRGYRVLAESVTAVTIGANPETVQRWATNEARAEGSVAPPDPKAVRATITRAATAIAAAINMPVDEVMARLSRPGKHVVLLPLADADVAAKVRQLSIPGLSFDPTDRREYPFESLASAVIGYCNAEQVPDGGVERWFRQVTEPETLALPVRYDGWDRQILGPDIGARPRPKPGKDLILTIHVPIQQKVEEEIQRCVASRHPAGVNVVVMSACSGEILALGCWPNFNPNSLSKARWGRTDVTPEQLVNRAVTKPMEPGSTLKLLTIAAGLEYGVITEHSVFHCGGTENIGGEPLECWGPWAKRGHGALTPEGVLINSCNLCAAKIALKIGGEKLCAFLRRCGLGQPTYAGFPNENPGRLFSLEREPGRKVRQKMWVRDVACMGFGQGITASDVQLAAAFCAILNGGLYYQPHIAAGYISPEDGDQYMVRPRVLRRVCSERTSAIMRRLAWRVVESGTGRPAAIPGAAVGGKTATAQIWDPVQRVYRKDPQHSLMSFVLAAPINRKPDFLVLVSVERPKVGEYGGEVAGPVARRIAEHILAQPGLLSNDAAQQTGT